MKWVVIDSNIVSYLFKRDSRADLYRPHLTDALPIISFMTLAEMDQWVLQRQWGEHRKQRLEQYLNRFTIQPTTRGLCRRWAQIRDDSRDRGRLISNADARIAATAVLHDLPLVTHNRRHFEGLSSLDIISEAPI